jgi:hypothetical protein
MGCTHTRAPHDGAGSSMWCSAKKPAASSAAGVGTNHASSWLRRNPVSCEPPTLTLLPPGGAGGPALELRSLDSESPAEPASAAHPSNAPASASANASCLMAITKNPNQRSIMTVTSANFTDLSPSQPRFTHPLQSRFTHRGPLLAAVAKRATQAPSQPPAPKNLISPDAACCTPQPGRRSNRHSSNSRRPG